MSQHCRDTLAQASIRSSGDRVKQHGMKSVRVGSLLDMPMRPETRPRRRASAQKGRESIEVSVCTGPKKSCSKRSVILIEAVAARATMRPTRINRSHCGNSRARWHDPCHLTQRRASDIVQRRHVHRHSGDHHIKHRRRAGMRAIVIRMSLHGRPCIHVRADRLPEEAGVKPAPVQ